MKDFQWSYGPLKNILVRSSPPTPSVTFWWNLAGSISMRSSFASYQRCSGWRIFSGVMALWKIFLSALPHLHRVLHFDETWQEASVWSLVLHLTNAVPVEGFSVEFLPFEKIFLSALFLNRVLHFDETRQEGSVWTLVLHLTNTVLVEWFSVELCPSKNIFFANLVYTTPPKGMVAFKWNLVESIGMKSSVECKRLLSFQSSIGRHLFFIKTSSYLVLFLASLISTHSENVYIYKV